jgi:iron-sulfur cluster insertion protein
MNKKLITVTSLAIKQLQIIRKNEKTKGILFSIKSGGCNGFEYKFEGINKFTNQKNIIIEDGLKIEVCDKSLFYLLGTNIDWKEDIMGKGFTFKNPMAQASCGCGTSFSVFEN